MGHQEVMGSAGLAPPWSTRPRSGLIDLPGIAPMVDASATSYDLSSVTTIPVLWATKHPPDDCPVGWHYEPEERFENGAGQAAAARAWPMPRGNNQTERHSLQASNTWPRS